MTTTEPKLTNEERLARHVRGLSAELGAARARARELEEQQREPIAVVGIGCRYPGGVYGADDLWRVVREGHDAISGLPADRGWDIAALYGPDPDAPGRSCTRSGGFLDAADRFDAEFFDVSPREATMMDPQQRLLLECAWEAVENAGVDPRSLRGTDTGVFVGANIEDYSHVLAAAPEAAEGFVVTGSTGAMVSGRISYCLGLHGPSATIDTACSSSLVALHQAVRSLRARDCAAALAGGCTVLATTRAFAEFSRQRALAPDGRCKAFGADADGFGLGEGAGVLFLERLSDARRHGHPVLAVIRGSAVNSDGASNGITAPNGSAQEWVIRDALAASGVPAHEVDLVEAHGTGTRLGDPIEARAVMGVYGAARNAAAPAWLGSVKSNIGHTQAAAGVAGVIKAVLALRHRILPPTLHADVPSPEIDWSADTVRLLTTARPWIAGTHPRRAGVSAFGISGTNAHLIVEEAPGAPDDAAGIAAEPARVGAETAGPPLVPWLLSARSGAALRAQAGQLLGWSARRLDAEPDAVARALAHTRSRFEERAVVLAEESTAFRAALGALAAGREHPGLVQGTAGRQVRPAFLFSGQGSQRPGMGRELYAAFPTFAERFDAVGAELDPLLRHPLREFVFAEPGTPQAALLDRTEFAQPALFAVEVALAALLKSWGLRPDRLLGHSVGELAAAHCAGVLGLADACAVVAARGRLMQALPSGSMAAIQATEDEVLPLLRGREGRVCVAAVNGPRALVVSGYQVEVNELAEHWRERGRRVKPLSVGHAFHSPLMDGMLDDFLRVTSSVRYHEPSVPLVSSVTGKPATTSQLTDPHYWVRQVRQPVRFGDAVAALHADGVTAFLELGPDGALTGLAEDCLPAGDALCVASLRRDRPEARSVLTALARLHCRGVEPDWAALLPGRGPHLDLPTYPFQRERYWCAPEPRTDSAEDRRFWALAREGDSSALATELGVAPDAPLPTILPALTRWRERAAQRTGAEGWRHGVTWRPLPPATGTALTGPWLLVGEAPEIEAILTELGAQVVRVPVPEPVGRAELARLLAGTPEPVGVISALALDTAAPGALDSPVTATLALLQALGDAGISAALWCLTRGAVAVGGESPDPASAGVWGLGRVAALEHPDRWGGLIDLPGAALGDQGALLATALCGHEDQVALRGDTVWARRVVRLPAGTGAPPELPGTVLVTGGTGGLGARVARSLAAGGAQHLLLLGRRGPDAPGAPRLREELEEYGARVTVRACDVSDRAALARVLAEVPGDLPLRAVVHTAGVLDDGVLDALTPERLTTVLAAKSVAAWHLHELTLHQDLVAFVMFSSLSGVIGTPGQGNYAAANAQLDALAEHRRALGCAATSVAWGPWAEEGMAHRLDTGRLGANGLRPMPSDKAIEALWHAVADERSTIMVADADWNAFAARAASLRPVPQLDELAATAAGPAPHAVTLRQDLGDLSPAERQGLLLDVVSDQLAVVLGRGHGWRPDPDRPFKDLGIDSLTAVELRNRLAAVTGLPLPATLVFDHPNAAAVVALIEVGIVTRAGTGPEQVLADIDRLEASLDATALDASAWAAVDARLRALLRTRSTEAEDGGSPSLTGASANEVIDFITGELGITLDPH